MFNAISYYYIAFEYPCLIRHMSEWCKYLKTKEKHPGSSYIPPSWMSIERFSGFRVLTVMHRLVASWESNRTQPAFEAAKYRQILWTKWHTEAQLQENSDWYNLNFGRKDHNKRLPRKHVVILNVIFFLINWLFSMDRYKQLYFLSGIHKDECRVLWHFVSYEALKFLHDFSRVLSFYTHNITIISQPLNCDHRTF